MARELEEIPGVGPATAGALTGQGLGSVKKVARAKVKQVAATPGFGEIRARRVRDAARHLGSVASKPKKKAPKAKKTKAKVKAKKKKSKR